MPRRHRIGIGGSPLLGHRNERLKQRAVNRDRTQAAAAGPNGGDRTIPNRLDIGPRCPRRNQSRKSVTPFQSQLEKGPQHQRSPFRNSPKFANASTTDSTSRAGRFTTGKNFGRAFREDELAESTKAVDSDRVIKAGRIDRGQNEKSPRERIRCHPNHVGGSRLHRWLNSSRLVVLCFGKPVLLTPVVVVEVFFVATIDRLNRIVIW